MLVGAGFENNLLAVVRSHHEMLDGSGYPDGLRGEAISDLVRLVTICDIYSDVHVAISGVSLAATAGESPTKPNPQEIKRSISPDFLISFEDGKPYKTLRRHLTLLGLTPEAYRAKWGLDPDYPMTAQTYSEQRSQLARSLGLGLGQQRRTFAEVAAAEAEQQPEPEPILVTPPARKPRLRSKEEA